MGATISLLTKCKPEKPEFIEDLGEKIITKGLNQ